MKNLFRALLISSILILSGFYSFSQQMISLSPLRKEIADRKFFVSEVIDARSEKIILGTVLTLNNNKETAKFKNGFHEEMKNFLRDLLQPQPTLMPVVVRVLKLTVFETKTAVGSEEAQVELIVEFYQQTAAGLILLKSTGSTVVKSAPLNVTRFHDESITSCFVDCFRQLDAHVSGNYPTESFKAVVRQELFKTPEILDVYDFPIMSDTIYRKGIFKNFIEFRNNNPSSGQEVRKAMMGKEAGQLESVWGYSDGANVFIQLAGRSFELEREENIFWFYGYEIAEIKNEVTGETLLATLFTGNITWKSTVNSKLIKYAINLGNGDLFPLD